ncbi:MAG: LLM class F420-dependent oxidoreductase [Bellilinea sp.]
MDISIMIEGQNGLNWQRWQRIVKLVEDLGFYGLYRSDHFTNSNPPDIDSLELWTSLTWLAGNTRRIHFGPLVTPVSFRHPVLTARMAAAVDDLSGGRLTLGIGAGWQSREHANFGFDLLPLKNRFDRFEEGIKTIMLLLQQKDPVSFDGDYYQLQDAILLPRPQRAGGPPLLIGGSGKRRTMPLAARYASEWNGIFLTPEQFKDLSAHLDGLMRRVHREPSSIRRTVMTGLVFGKDQSAFNLRLSAVAGGKTTSVELKQRGLIVGTPVEVIAQLQALAEAGVEGVMLQWLDLDDLAGLEELAKTVLPRFAAQ